MSEGKKLEQNIVLKPGDTGGGALMRRLLSAPWTAPVIVAVAALGFAPLAQAQVMNVPRRAAETTQPRTASDPLVTSSTLTAGIFGGYDDNISEGGEFGEVAGPPPLLTGSGGVGQGAIGYHYSRTRGTKGIALGTDGIVNTYGGLDVDPSYNASLGFSAFTGFGRSNTFTFSELLNYDSLYGLGTLGVVDDQVTAPNELPTSTAVEGILPQKSFATSTGISLARDWSRRDITSVGYSYGSRTFTGDNGETSFSHTANASYNRATSRNTTVSMNYNYSNAEYAGSFTAGPRRPVDNHNIEGGFTFTKRVSPRRSLDVGFSGGASYIETVSTELLDPYTYWAPTGGFNARLDLSQTWSLSGNYRRTTTGFEGLSNETFMSDVAGVSVGGLVGERVTLVFSGGAASGNVDASATGTGAYTTGTGAVQMSIGITRTLSATVRYAYYQYSFSSDTVLPEGVASEFNRNAFRAGLTLNLPFGRRQPRAPQP